MLCRHDNHYVLWSSMQAHLEHGTYTSKVPNCIHYINYFIHYTNTIQMHIVSQ